MKNFFKIFCQLFGICETETSEVMKYFCLSFSYQDYLKKENWSITIYQADPMWSICELAYCRGGFWRAFYSRSLKLFLFSMIWWGLFTAKFFVRENEQFIKSKKCYQKIHEYFLFVPYWPDRVNRPSIKASP